ncbi:MAG: Uma2 family endonuclease [Cyanobacteria bacterium SID2]|nr:Uma2 family endonuclease [Cyanobacteria bacterium SID2]MBP0006635.1 Uma2 family endonuclease [Cyanobacteria bacterium SBC]
MAVSTEGKTLVSLDKYRAAEEISEFKSEYRDGEIVPMTGGTYEYNGIALNWVTCLKVALRGKNYHVRAGDMRLWIPQYRQAVYPDVLVISGAPVFNENRRDEILNPCLIAEVLSDSTEARDRGDKFRYYQSISEFQEYLLVSQYDARVEQFVRVGVNEWSLRVYDDLAMTVQLGAIDLEVAMRDIYEGIAFEV